MRALLLSGSLGMGHDVMAEACAVSLERRGWSTDTMNSLTLMGDAAGGWGERVFRGLLAVPGVYDAFHFEQLRPGGRLARMAEKASDRYAVPALTRALEHRPAELVVSVFATGAGAASRVKASTHPQLRTAVFCTDVNPHRLWVHGNTDLFLVTSTTAQRFVHRFQPRADVVIVPTPVRPPFYAAPDQVAARTELGASPGAPCVLLMAGAWGIGPITESAAALAHAGVHTIAVAGRNAKLAAALRDVQVREPRVIPFGFTDQVPTLMAAADIVVTSSGDTCSEARVIGRHLLLLDVVPGHGRENLQHELERGSADVAPTDPEGLVRSALACLDRVEPAQGRGPGTAQAWEDAFSAALARMGLAGAVAPRALMRGELGFGLLAALGAAALYGAAPIAQAVVARRSPPARGVGLRLMIALARRPVWLLGLVGEIGAFALEAYAFSVVPATFAAPVLAVDMVVFVVLGRIVFGEALSRVGQTGALTMTVAVALLAIAFQGNTTLGAPADDHELFGFLGGCVAAAALTALFGGRALRRNRPTTGAVIFAFGSGIAYGFATLCTRQVGRTFTGSDVWELLRTPTPYVLAGASILAIGLMQRGLQTGALVTFPIVSGVSAVLPVAIGAAVLDDPVPAGGGRVLFVATLLLLTAGLSAVARDRTRTQAATDAHADGATDPPAVAQH